MTEMLADATSFNQDISSWNISRVSEIYGMFDGALAFNQNLCPWASILPDDAYFLWMFEDTACPSGEFPNGTHASVYFCYPCD